MNTRPNQQKSELFTIAIFGFFHLYKILEFEMRTGGGMQTRDYFSGRRPSVKSRKQVCFNSFLFYFTIIFRATFQSANEIFPRKQKVFCTAVVRATILVAADGLFKIDKREIVTKHLRKSRCDSTAASRRTRTTR